MVLCTLLACLVDPVPVSASPGVEPWIVTSGTRFVDAWGGQVVLRGVDAHPAANAAGLAATGVNFVRIFVKWSDIEPAAPIDGTHAWSTSALAQIDELVIGLRDRGIHVLIDFHQCGWSRYWESSSSGCAAGIPAWYYVDGRFSPASGGRSAARAAWWTTEANRSHAAYLPFVRMMVRRYRSYPNVMGYEVFNEPQAGNLGDSTAATNTLLRWQRPVVRAIRALDPWRAIVFMCRGGGEGVGTADLSKIGRDPHLVLDWHNYFNGEPGTGLDAAGDNWRPSWPATHLQVTAPYEGTVEAQRAVLSVPVSKAAAAGIPLLVGEWGTRRDDVNAETYQSTMLELFAEHGLSWARWSYSTTDSLGIRNADGTLNASGRQLRDYLTSPSAFDPPTPQPFMLRRPSISGRPSLGVMLGATRGAWDGDPQRFTFLWKRCTSRGCTSIQGADARRYRIRPADAGSRLRVRVTARNPSGTASGRSKRTARVS